MSESNTPDVENELLVLISKFCTAAKDYTDELSFGYAHQSLESAKLAAQVYSLLR